MKINNIYNKLLVFMNINELDAKCTIEFLPNDYVNDNTLMESSCIKNSNNMIWKIDNFLLENECQLIIDSAEKVGFEYLKYRNSSRLIGFENSGNLTKLIEDRLKTECLLNKINNKKLQSTPYGFGSNYIKWNKLEPLINKCYRINKYTNNQEFKFHRDAQYTQSDNVKSSHTLLIYLNDDFDGGNTVFRISKKEYINIGYTISEELDVIGNDYIDIVIKPEKGMALLFDQRLLHAGQILNNGTKYVLRTDLIREGLKDTYKLTELENKIYNLSKSIFRQAQLLELKDKPTVELYEICIGLRQHPHLIKTYPEHLEKLLVNTLDEKVELNKYNINLIKRTGLKYVYKYKLNDEHTLIDILKFAYGMSIYMSCKDFHKNTKNNIIKTLDKLFNLNIKDEDDDNNDDDDEDDDNNDDDKYDDDDDEYDEDDKNKVTKNDDNKEDEFEDDVENMYFEDSYTLQELIENEEVYDDGSEVFNQLNKMLNIDLNPHSFVTESLLNIEPLNLKCSVKALESGERCERNCMLCDESCYEPADYDNTFFNPSVKLHDSPNFSLEFSKLDINNKYINGTMCISAFTSSFNHASCQCSTVIEFGEELTFYKKVKINSDFSFNTKKQELTIELVPLIIM